MSTIQNSLLMEFSDRIASARGPAAWNQLAGEINAAPLADGAKETLHEIIANRFGQERELIQQLHPA